MLCADHAVNVDDWSSAGMMWYPSAWPTFGPCGCKGRIRTILKEHQHLSEKQSKAFTRRLRDYALCDTYVLIEPKPNFTTFLN